VLYATLICRLRQASTRCAFGHIHGRPHLARRAWEWGQVDSQIAAIQPDFDETLSEILSLMQYAGREPWTGPCRSMEAFARG